MADNIDTFYTFGLSPHQYLTERQYTHCLALRGLVQDVRDQWKMVPVKLRPLAEDLSKETPAWLTPRVTAQRESLMGDAA